MDSPTTNQLLDLVIVSPDETLFEGQVRRLLAPGIFQQIAILPNHTPIFAQLIKGVLTLTLTDLTEKNIDIEGGIVRVKSNKVSLLTGF